MYSHLVSNLICDCNQKTTFVPEVLQQIINPLKTEGILKTFQKVIELTQKWRDFKNNGTT
jgi:predicted methyltransferase